MVGMVIGAVLNMILDPVFIFTFNMGVMGAAVATAISQAVSFAILSSNYWRKKDGCKIPVEGLQVRAEIVSYIVRVGSSTF